MALGKVCRISDCSNILKKQDGQVCGAHRLRFMRHGNYEINPNWSVLKKGKPSKNTYGYMRINIDGKRVLEHRHIMEKFLGRPLNKDERVHHKNHIRDDNRIENLVLCATNSEHMKKHHKDMWKKRKVGGEYTANTIKSIMNRLSEQGGVYKKCFCGGKYAAKNLCSKHYVWARSHNFV